MIAAALLWDFFLAEPPSQLHPTVWMGNYIGCLWKRRPRGKKTALFLYGVFIISSGVLLFAGGVYALTYLIGMIPGLPGRWILLLAGVPLLKVSFSLRYLFRSAKEIRTALENGDLQESRRLTSWHLVSRDTSQLTENELSSCVIESVSENITDSFTSPVFFYCLAGLPGAWAYRFINTSDAMIAYRHGDHEWGGKFTAWCDSVLNLIPARLTSLMIVLAAFIHPRSSGTGAWKQLVKDRKNTASPNAGWTMSAMAGALSVRLEKQGDYILGDEYNLPDHGKIDTALQITLLSLILTITMFFTAIRGVQWVLYTAV